MLAPLKVTFMLDTPMVPSAYPIHLDALVAYALTQTKLAAMDKTVQSNESIRQLAADLPFAKEARDGEWVWQASALVPEVVGEQSVRMWTRKTNTYDYATRAASGAIELGARTQNALADGKLYAGTIDTARGLLKNQFEFYPVAEVFQLSAWCIGDIDQLETLLAPESGLITHLGKRGRIGHGRIRSVEFSAAPDAAERWKLRVLPWRESDAYEPLVAAFQPPYWAVENRKAAFVPVDF